MANQSIPTLTTQPRPVQSRLMRRMVFLMLSIFAVISFIGYRAVQFNARDDFAFVQEIALNEVEDTIVTDILEPAYSAVLSVSTSPSAQAFALETVSLSSSDGLLETQQAELTTQFRDLLENRDTPFIAARYIMRTGAIWTEAARDENGNIESNLGFALSNDESVEIIQSGLSTEFGSVRLTRLDIRETENGVLPVLSLVSPIARSDDLNSVLGVIHVEMDATELFRTPNIVASDPIIQRDNRRVMLINSQNRILADSAYSNLNYLLTLQREDYTYPEPDEAMMAFLNANQGILSVAAGPSLGFNRLNSTLISTRDINFGDAPGMPWRVVLIDDGAAAFQTANLISFGLLLLNLVGLGVVLVVTNFWLNEHLRPLGLVGQMLGGLAASEQEPPKQLESSETPAIIQDYEGYEDAQMYHTANQIAAQLATLNRRIESQSLRYNRNLSVAARISRETAQLNDVDELMTHAIELMSTSFGLYHTQVFLLDDIGENAVLAYSLGEAGRKLLQEGHKLPVGSASVIGRVTAQGRPVIVNDTQAQGRGQTHAFNPILSETRAEMAIPLQIGDEIIGALDLQSNRPNVFSEEDVQTYQLVADQIAIAVYKTRLLRKSDERIEQIEKLNRQLTQMAWEELEKQYGLEQTYRYDQMRVEAGDISPEIYATSELLSVPIMIRGETIGTINAMPPEPGSFTDDDQIILNAIAERVALAVENARLFQETQVNLSETTTMYDITRALNEADDMRSIIQAILSSAMQDAVAGQIAIFDEYKDDPEWMEIVSSWMDSAHTSAQLNETDWLGQRFWLSDYALLSGPGSDQVVLVQDAEHDIRLEPEMRMLFEQIGCRSAAFIPLKARTVHRGYIFVEFLAPREFSEREGRIYTNLVDQAGVAVDNLLLSQQTAAALQQNERLYAGSRIINQAQGVEDLVRASVATSDNPDLNFGLALFEGQLDDLGWSTRINHVAQSRNGGIYVPDHTYEVAVSPDSPLRGRHLETVSDATLRDNPDHVPFVELLRANGDHYGTFFPLFSSSQAIALFIVSRKQQIPLEEYEREIYLALAGQMSTVLQNRQLLDRTALALDETRRLYRASSAITAAQDTDAMYEVVGEHLYEPMPRLTRLSILRAYPDPIPEVPYLDVSYVWHQVEEVGGFDLNQRLESSMYPFGQMVPKPENMRYITNLDKELADFPTLQTYFVQNKSQSVIVEPITSRNRWLGVIVIESHDRHAFDEQYVRFVRALGDQIAIALENQLLFVEAQQEARQALALAEASQLANQIGGEFDEGIRSLLARVAETASYDRWLLMLLNRERSALNIVTEQMPDGIQSLVPSVLTLAQAEHSIADAVRFNRTLMVNDPSEYPAFMDNPDAIMKAGKHIATPIIAGEKIIGSLLIGRPIDAPDMTERDETLISTLAAQVAVTLENRRLFVEAENERATLGSILNTLPAGVLVLDAETLIPELHNGQIEGFLGRKLDENMPFSAAAYDLYRTGTNIHYPADELPIMVCRRTGLPSFSDDISVITAEGHQTDLLINAAPITNNDGDVVSIVAAFENISNLRGLENTLQDNLRETISLYEATRSLSEADELNEVLDVAVFQLIMIEPEDAHIILLDEQTQSRTVARSMVSPLDGDQLPDAVFNSERILLIDDIQSHHDLNETDRAMLSGQSIGAIASIPLRARQRKAPLGWMLMTYSAAHSFSAEEERFLTTLSDNAAVAIDNRYLFERTEQARTEAESLYNVTTAINRSRTMTDLSRVIRDGLENLVPDIYAAYVMTVPGVPSTLDELFNISMDAAPVDFATLLKNYGLFHDEVIVIENLYGIETPSPFEQALMNLGNIQALISVSLRVKGNPDGRLFVAYHASRQFTQGDLRYINALADSASVVVDNITLLDQVQDALRETSTLYQASRSLADATHPDDILKVVVDRIIGSHVDQVFVALLTTRTWEEENATVQVMASWQKHQGVDLEGIALTAEQFPAWSLLGTRNVLVLNDVEADANLNDLEKIGITSMDTRAVAIIPLRVPSRAIGAVWIGSQTPHHHNDQERSIYKSFA